MKSMLRILLRLPAFVLMLALGIMLLAAIAVSALLLFTLSAATAWAARAANPGRIKDVAQSARQ